MNLFQTGEIESAAGITLPFKIDCDAFSNEDITSLAEIARALVSPSKVISVPTGGNRLAKELSKLVWSSGDMTVIVDDVWTTGSSVLKVAAENHLLDKLGTRACCLVIFARGSYPHWVKPIFNIHPVLKAQNFLWIKEYGQ